MTQCVLKGGRAKNERRLRAYGKSGGRGLSQSGGLAEVAVGDEISWTPNTADLRARARCLVSVWEQVFAAS